MNNALNWKSLLGIALAGAALAVAGCKSAPELTAASAQALIQAKYDKDPATPVSVNVNDLGMRQGVTAKYWDRSKSFPIKWWADFKLTDAGKKAVTLPKGGDTFEWHPETADDKNYSIVVNSVATNHLKAKDVKDPTDDAGGTKTAQFTEVVGVDTLPAPLAEIAHNPGNKLSTKRTATFSLDNGAWKLDSIQ